MCIRGYILIDDNMISVAVLCLATMVGLLAQVIGQHLINSVNPKIQFRPSPCLSVVDEESSVQWMVCWNHNISKRQAGGTA